MVMPRKKQRPAMPAPSRSEPAHPGMPMSGGGSSGPGKAPTGKAGAKDQIRKKIGKMC
jgi:hypothetical protein